jgi:hypothetical protein
MVKYWSGVALPLFLFVVAFGTFALFTTSDIQLLDSASFSIIPALMSSTNMLDNAVLSSAKAIKAMEADNLATATRHVKNASIGTTR